MKTKKDPKIAVQSLVKSHYAMIGEFMVMIDASPMPLDRKLFFQAAFFSGYGTDDLIEKMFAELKAAVKKEEEEIAKSEKDLEARKEELRKLGMRHAAETAERRRFLYALQKKLVEKTEKKVEGILAEETKQEISAIQKKLMQN